jgi:hypothetical protein
MITPPGGDETVHGDTGQDNDGCNQKPMTRRYLNEQASFFIRYLWPTNDLFVHLSDFDDYCAARGK